MRVEDNGASQIDAEIKQKDGYGCQRGYMLNTDLIVNIVTQTLREYGSSGIAELDPDALLELEGKLKERITREYDAQMASLQPVYGSDYSMMMHNLTMTLRRLGKYASADIRVSGGGGHAEVKITGMGDDSNGQPKYLVQLSGDDVATTVDLACRNILAQMAK